MTGKSGLRTHFDKEKYLKYHEDRPQNLKFLEKQVQFKLHIILIKIKDDYPEID